MRVRTDAREVLVKKYRPTFIWPDSTSDMSGEFYPTGSWSGEYRLGGDDYQNPLALVARVKVMPGKNKRPSRFSVTLQFRHDYRFSEKMYLKSNRCTSLREVEEAVKALNYKYTSSQLIKRYFSPVNGTCLYQIDIHDQLVPFCTAFDTFSLLDELPSGRYLGVSVETNTMARRVIMHFQRYEKTGTSRSSGGRWEGERDPNLYWLFDGPRSQFMDRWMKYWDDVLVRTVETKLGPIVDQNGNAEAE